MARTTDPPVSQAQRKAMGAAMSGHSNIGIPKSVGKEFIEADPGGKLPETSKDRSKTMNNPNDGGPGSGPKPNSGSRYDPEYGSYLDPKPSKQPSGRYDPNYGGYLEKSGRQKDVTSPKPSSGPMSTEGPGTGKSEGLPEAANAKESMRDSGSDCGKEMSLDAIKTMGKRIGKY